jgi:uncharacterized protein DUF2474
MGATSRLWLQRLAWLVTIWVASVAALAIAAFGMRLLMNAIGLSSS